MAMFRRTFFKLAVGGAASTAVTAINLPVVAKPEEQPVYFSAPGPFGLYPEYGRAKNPDIYGRMVMFYGNSLCFQALIYPTVELVEAIKERTKLITEFPDLPLTPSRKQLKLFHEFVDPHLFLDKNGELHDICRRWVKTVKEYLDS